MTSVFKTDTNEYTDQLVGLQASRTECFYFIPADLIIFPYIRILEVYMPPIPELEAIRRAQILEAALLTMSQNGCANVTMADIARAANLSKGGLAHYFPSKDELFKAVIKEFYRRIFERGRTVMEAYGDPIDKILSFAEWLYNREDPDINLGYPNLFDFMSIAVHDEDYRKLFSDWVDNWVKLLKTALSEAVKKGMLREMDVDEMARARFVQPGLRRGDQDLHREQHDQRDGQAQNHRDGVSSDHPRLPTIRPRRRRSRRRRRRPAARRP